MHETTRRMEYGVSTDEKVFRQRKRPDKYRAAGYSIEYLNYLTKGNGYRYRWFSDKRQGTWHASESIQDNFNKN